MLTPQQAYQHLRRRGLTHNHAAGIIGNWMVESANWDPRVFAGTRTGDAGTAFGGAQWRGQRFANLQRYARQRGADWRNNVGLQLDFFLEEGNPQSPYYDAGTGRAHQIASRSASPQAASDAIMIHAERPSQAARRHSGPIRARHALALSDSGEGLAGSAAQASITNNLLNNQPTRSPQAAPQPASAPQRAAPQAQAAPQRTVPGSRSFTPSEGFQRLLANNNLRGYVGQDGWEYYEDPQSGALRRFGRAQPAAPSPAASPASAPAGGGSSPAYNPIDPSQVPVPAARPAPRIPASLPEPLRDPDPVRRTDNIPASLPEPLRDPDPAAPAPEQTLLQSLLGQTGEPAEDRFVRRMGEFFDTLVTGTGTAAAGTPPATAVTPPVRVTRTPPAGFAGILNEPPIMSDRARDRAMAARPAPAPVRPPAPPASLPEVLGDPDPVRPLETILGNIANMPMPDVAPQPVDDSIVRTPPGFRGMGASAAPVTGPGFAETLNAPPIMSDRARDRAMANGMLPAVMPQPQAPGRASPSLLDIIGGLFGR